MVSIRTSKALLSTASCVIALLCATQLHAGSTPVSTAVAGGFAGRVTSLRDHKPLAGVVIEAKGTGQKTVTARDGSYHFANLAPGSYTLVLTTLSGLVIEQPVVVGTDQATSGDIVADSAASAADEIIVLAQRTPKEVARAAQREAINLVNIQTYQEIRKLPDISAAEAVRRVPGISLETDEGEGRYVNIRGLDADLNSTTFGGLRLPPTNNASPFGGYRAVTLDSIPAGLIGAITVTKSNLPSQDAEALGGTIEITPKTAPSGGKPFIQGNIGTGYESLRKTGIIDLGLTVGTHFGGKDKFFGSGPFSIVLTASYYEDRRGIDDLEPAYFNDPQGVAGSRPYRALANIDQRIYQLNRKRHSYGIDLGYQPDGNNSFYIRAFDAGYGEKYDRPHLSITPDGAATLGPNGQIQDTLAGAGSLTNQLRDEYEKSIDRVIVAGGKNVFGDNTLDYRVGYTAGTYSKPYDYGSTFTIDPNATTNAAVTYSPTGPGSVPVYKITGVNYTDPTLYTLSGLYNSSAYNFDREWSFATNFEHQAPLFGADSGSFKFGLSARLRHKQTNNQPTSYAMLPAINLATAAGSLNNSYYHGIYQNGAEIQAGYLQGIVGSGSISASDAISSAQQYLDAHENIYAAYGEYMGTWGKFSLLVGARVERTEDRSSAFGTSTSGGVTTAFPVNATGSYTNFFPSAQMKYAFEPSLIARATYSSTIARPGFNQSSAALAVDLGAHTITLGNPALNPARADSFDVTVEKYLGGAGIISAGVFYKTISGYILPNVIVDATGLQTALNLPAIANFSGPKQIITFSNAGNSYARGIELNFDHRFHELPGLLGGLGISANFTYVDSRVQIRPGEFSALPSTSKYTYNAALFYEKGPLNLRLAAYSTSSDIFGIGGDKTTDVYNATRTSMDFGGSYAVNKHGVIYFAAKNLLDTPHEFYQGTVDRPIQREFYGQTYQIGLRFDY